MNAPSLTDAELELKRCEEEAQRLEQQLAEARELPRRIALEKQERDNTLPPCERLAEIRRMRAHEAEIATRRETGNLQKAQTRSLLLLLTLGAAIIALFAWGFRLMNG
jgi:hypothetical protein